MKRMPTFCRHNHLLQNCTICAREQNFDARPVVSSSAPKSSLPREERVPAEQRTPRAAKPGATRSRTGVRVRRLARGVEDGYRSPLLPGLKSSEDAERLAEELAFSTTRLSLMEQVAAGEQLPGIDPCWSEIAAPGDLDARTLLAFLHVLDGPRGLKSGNRDDAIAGFEAWGARTGSYEQAFTGEQAWTPERRFERLFERLGGVRGLDRDTRYGLLTLLGRLGVYELRAGKLFPGGENEATWAAKRALGIGDPLLLERRAADLAQACQVPIESLDLALHNWGSGARITDGLAEESGPDELLLEQARDALRL
ncbi:MAG TPA: hypothetical protein VG228_02460 [Solirubrobacteraceae bacterium]|jgi:hypothetical protein|nr:hypothetical protein [Solirubrobacteraceae bacterium]